MQGFIRHPLAVSVVASVALTGCFGGSSSDDDGDVITSDLSDEQQAVAAAQGLSGLDGQADAVGDGLDVPSDNGDTSGDSGSLAVASSQDIPCESGSMTVDDAASFPGGEVPFPEGVGAPSDTLEGTSAVAEDCTFDGGSVTMDGQFEIMEFGGGMESGSGATYIRAGGVSGEDYADIGSAMDMGGSSSMQGHMMLCYSCRDADLGDMAGPQEYSAMVAHMRTEMESMDMELRLGDNVPDGDPLTVVTRPSGDGALVEVDGRQAFAQGDCAIDVTMSTANDGLQVDAWGPNVSNPQIESGEMELTTNESGETYDLEWNDDTLFVDNEEVSEDALEGFDDC